MVRAAERSHHLAVPLVDTLPRPYFIAYAVAVAHAADMPIAVHLDHCTLAADAVRALALPTAFNSIMVDGEVEYVRDVVAHAHARGVTIEAELGCVGGAEDGVPTADGVLTDPAVARAFVKRPGVHYLAPSFGNVHGGQYGDAGLRAASSFHAWPTSGGPCWRQPTPGAAVPLVLHDTSPTGDALIRSAIAEGMRKVSARAACNSWSTALPCCRRRGFRRKAWRCMRGMWRG